MIFKVFCIHNNWFRLNLETHAQQGSWVAASANHNILRTSSKELNFQRNYWIRDIKKRITLSKSCPNFGTCFDFYWWIWIKISEQVRNGPNYKIINFLCMRSTGTIIWKIFRMKDYTFGMSKLKKSYTCILMQI